MTPRPGLADARKRAGFNQEAFAEEVGVTKHTISQWETGATGINSRRRPVIAAALGISLAELDRLIKGEPLDKESVFGPLDALDPGAVLDPVLDPVHVPVVDPGDVPDPQSSPGSVAGFRPTDRVPPPAPGDRRPCWLIDPDRIPRRPYTVVPVPATGLLLSAEHGESGLARTRRILGQLTSIIRIADPDRGLAPRTTTSAGPRDSVMSAHPGRRPANGRGDLR